MNQTRTVSCHANVLEMFEDTKGVIKSRKSKKERQHNVQRKKDKQRYIKRYTEN